ncbi:hypothetical protein SDC9_190832 [bioreactor metagenome]|uniref:Uncharacterized protein n=1 Tax=bioreactor metagenome TaxID=1076179 RepID=A0A645I751_9ZZZZ
MERQRNHALCLVQLDGDHRVIIGAVPRREFAVCLRSAMRTEIFRGFTVGFPNGAQAGRLRGHDIHAVSIVRREM